MTLGTADGLMEDAHSGPFVPWPNDADSHVASDRSPVWIFEMLC